MKGKSVEYDVILGGAGAAGLMLGHILTMFPETRNMHILIIEPEEKAGNDHTWSSWVNGHSHFDNIAKKNWQKVDIYHQENHLALDLGVYKYRMILSDDFYHMTKMTISAMPNVEWVVAKVDAYREFTDRVEVQANTKSYSGKYFFKNYIDYHIDKSEHLYVDQHFRGWFIHTSEDEFDPTRCTMMDFRIENGSDTRFMYVLPSDKRTALIEIAIFSNDTWTYDRYDDEIKRYINEVLSISNSSFIVKDKETGIIPMTTYPFEKHDTNRVIHIGGAGGAIKASSGYAFSRIERQTEALVKAIVRGQPLIDVNKRFNSRHRLYDKTMLRVLMEHPELSGKIFFDLFKKNNVERVFKFLDEKTAFLEELRLMSTTDISLFLKSFLKSI